MMRRLRLGSALGAAIAACVVATQSHAQQTPEFDEKAVASLPAFRVPFSALASPQSGENLVEFTHNLRLRNGLLKGVSDPKEIRRIVDETYIGPMLERLRRKFAVQIRPEVIGGVATDIVTPKAGVPAANASRVLINLHGGGFSVGAHSIGQVESVPIASLGGYKVVTVDYRMAPEARFPAASEDVARVYAELLKTYRPENIGVYGCSAGAMLTAQSIAWFQAHGLPRPAAIAMSGGGGVVDSVGDSAYVSAPLGGYAIADFPPQMREMEYMRGANLKSALASPAHHDSLLKLFPPTLLISGTRDLELSRVVYTHARLVESGAEADLHVFEGQQHCSIYWDLPESRQAWKVIIRFFDSHLGRR